MMNWAKKTLASVAGTPEPIYGPSAVCSVDTQTAETPYTELTKKDLTWQVLDVTSVETQTFYIFTPAGHIGMAQIIYSNVSNIKTTVQFNSKIFYPKSENKPHLWCSDALSNVDFDEDKTSFYADNVALELSEDGKTYTIKSMVNEESFVDLTITRDAPGFLVGKDGKTTFGTDLANPWGSVSHAFWPRNTCKGTIVTKDGPIDFGGQAIFVMALQGMKPHHAAAKWNFVNFHGPNVSAIMMEFTTPPSYGSTKVTVGGIARDGEIICAGSSMTVEHTTVKGDAQNDWPEPETVKFVWEGKTKDGKDVHAVMEGPLDERIDKVDVLAHVPGFIKQIAAGAAGTKPYIYQFSPKEISLKLKIGDQETVESGRLFSEATFVCP